MNDFANVEVVVAALDDHDDELAELLVQSSYPLSGAAGAERVLVRVARLDTLVREQQVERVDLVKIDVDGHEARVLRGALETLRRHRPALFFEITPSLVEAGGDSIEELLGSLLALSYAIADEGGVRLLDPVRRARSLPRGAGCNLFAVPLPPLGSSRAASGRLAG